MLTSVHGHYAVRHMLRMKSLLLRKTTFVFKLRVWMFTHTGVKSSNQGQCFHLRLQTTDHRHGCLLLNFRSAWKCLVPNLVF